mmetsp:Transcript_35791/g.31576  ORF Transcript_35791/g.31576 Transcript_35791/m.31576 type:complete len:165 (+) Transcript_35791:26-520(+)
MVSCSICNTMIVILSNLIWKIILTTLSFIESIVIFGCKLEDLPVVFSILKAVKIVMEHDKVEMEMNILKEETNNLQTSIDQLKDLNQVLLTQIGEQGINQTQYNTFIDRIPSKLQPKYQVLINKPKYGYFTDLFYYDPQASIPVQSIQELINDLCLNHDTTRSI